MPSRWKRDARVSSLPRTEYRSAMVCATPGERLPPMRYPVQAIIFRGGSAIRALFYRTKSHCDGHSRPALRCNGAKRSPNSSTSMGGNASSTLGAAAARSRVAPSHGCWRLQSGGCGSRPLPCPPISARPRRSRAAAAARRPTGRGLAGIRSATDGDRDRRHCSPRSAVSEAIVAAIASSMWTNDQTAFPSPMVAAWPRAHLIRDGLRPVGTVTRNARTCTRIHRW